MVACADCTACQRRDECTRLCDIIESMLPSMEAGRIDAEDIPRIAAGRLVTHLILDNFDLLTERQQQVVQLYFREDKLQNEIAQALQITQQAVADILARVRERIWGIYHRNRDFVNKYEKKGIFYQLPEESQS